MWADERLTDVVRGWTAYSPYARIRVEGGPVGSRTGVWYFHGPARRRRWPPVGVGTFRSLRGHQVLPLRPDVIPVSLVSALAEVQERG